MPVEPHRVHNILENQSGLKIFQQSVVDLLVEGDQVVGCKTQMGLDFYAPCVVLTTGTFLDGKIHIGHEQQPGGRAGDAPSSLLALSACEGCRFGLVG